MKKQKVKGIWVLDGYGAKLKERTQELRQAKKEKHEKAMEESFAKNQLDDALYHSKASVKMTAQYHDEIKELLECAGVAWTQSEGEADLKIAALFRSGKVDGVLSDDSDLLAHGVNKLYRTAPKSSRLC